MDMENEREESVTSWEIKRALAESHEKDFFLTEVKNGSTYFPPAQGLLRFDGFAMTRSYRKPCIKIYEVKVSRSDFLRDNKWNLYKQYCNELYFVTPKGLIDKLELPDDVGLIYYNRDGSRKLVTKRKALWREIEEPVDVYKYLIYSRLDQDRIPFFNDRKEYAEAYLQDKKNKRYIGIKLGSKMAKELQEARERLEMLENREHHLTVFDAIRKVLDKYNLDPFSWRFNLDWKGDIFSNGRSREPDPEVYQRKIDRFKEELDNTLATGITSENLKSIERGIQIIQQTIEEIGKAKVETGGSL